MPLTCSCPWDGEFEWYWWRPNGYSVMPIGRARKRCTSCHILIPHGSIVARIARTRGPKDVIEERIYGEDDDAISLAPAFLCERCADLYFSLTELGFECVSPYESMPDLVKNYAAGKWEDI